MSRRHPTSPPRCSPSAPAHRPPAARAPAQARILKTESKERKLTELPASITCNVSLLVPAGDVFPGWECSPAYYNCLGVDIGGQGPLSWCQDGLVFDKTYFAATSTFPNGQGGACNWGAPACPHDHGHDRSPRPGTSPAVVPPVVPAGGGVSTAPVEPLAPTATTAAPELPASIACPTSTLVSAEVVNATYACSAAYYNCLGVPTYAVATSTYPAGQGGACNYATPACSAASAHPPANTCSPLGFSPVPGNPNMYNWCTPNGMVQMPCAPGTTWGAGCP
eukprot:scaffold22.g6155.t1